MWWTCTCVLRCTSACTRWPCPLISVRVKISSRHARELRIRRTALRGRGGVDNSDIGTTPVFLFFFFTIVHRRNFSRNQYCVSRHYGKKCRKWYFSVTVIRTVFFLIWINTTFSLTKSLIVRVNSMDRRFPIAVFKNNSE